MARHLIAVAVDDGEDSLATVSSRFGRCKRFVLFDAHRGDVVSTWENEGQNAVEGAGIKTANEIASRGAHAVLAGEFGPKAQRALDELGIEASRADAGITVRAAVEQYMGAE